MRLNLFFGWSISRSAAATLLLATLVVVLAACGPRTAGDPGAAPAGTQQAVEGIGDRSVRVVATTNFVADLASQVGGDRVTVDALMGPGVDPHLYKASAGDVDRLEQADLIAYVGLDLEGRMSDLFGEVGRERNVVAVADSIPAERLLAAQAGAYEHDPHVWFDVELWQLAAREMGEALARTDPDHADEYAARADAYVAELEELDSWADRQLRRVPERSRVLVTSHDAFRYFGRAYGYEVRAIQGISTATEATTGDVERIARLIAERELRAVFVESSVPPQTLEAVLAAARQRGWEARIGGSLYSDAAGDAGTPEGTYVGMVRHNVETIVEGLAP